VHGLVLGDCRGARNRRPVVHRTTLSQCARAAKMRGWGSWPSGKEQAMSFAELARGAAMAVVVTLTASTASAQTVAEFYRGKSIDLYINVSVGGGYDLYARMVARHLGKHIPGNPTILPKNMEGGGGMRLANWLYNVGPKDGTAIGAVTRATAF